METISVNARDTNFEKRTDERYSLRTRVLIGRTLIFLILASGIFVTCFLEEIIRGIAHPDEIYFWSSLGIALAFLFPIVAPQLARLLPSFGSTFKPDPKTVGLLLFVLALIAIAQPAFRLIVSGVFASLHSVAAPSTFSFMPYQ